MELHRVLSRVAVRSPGDHGHALVDDPALGIVEFAQFQLPVFRPGQRHPTGKDLLGNFNTAVSREPQDPNGGYLMPRRYGGDGV